MTEQQRQHISALVDSELDSTLVAPTIAALEASPELAATWERYHLIGQAMRGEAVRAEYRELAARVREQLAREPVPLSPHRLGHGRHRVGPFAGAALAAAAAFLAVFAVPQLFGPQPQVSAPAQTLATTGPATQFYLAQPDQRWLLDRPELQDKLNHFLVNHQAQSPSGGIKGFMPYATVIGYDSGR